MGRIPAKVATITSLAFLLGAAGSGVAQQVSVYRCIDADGRIALQDRPCPPGQLDRQRTVHLDPPPSPPTAVAAADPPAEQAPAAASDPAPSQPPGEPPPLWRCVDFEGNSRLSPRDDPRPRYVPYWVVAGNLAGPRGLAGRAGAPPPQAGSAAPDAPGSILTGQLPPMVRVEDHCVQLSARAACTAFRAQRDASRQRRYNSVTRSDRESLDAEIARLQSILLAHCGG